MVALLSEIVGGPGPSFTPFFLKSCLCPCSTEWHTSKWISPPVGRRERGRGEHITLEIFVDPRFRMKVWISQKESFYSEKRETRKNSMIMWAVATSWRLEQSQKNSEFWSFVGCWRVMILKSNVKSPAVLHTLDGVLSQAHSWLPHQDICCNLEQGTVFVQGEYWDGTKLCSASMQYSWWEED